MPLWIYLITQNSCFFPFWQDLLLTKVKQEEPQEVESEAGIAIISSQTASAKVLQGFLAWQGIRKGKRQNRGPEVCDNCKLCFVSNFSGLETSVGQPLCLRKRLTNLNKHKYTQTQPRQFTTAKSLAPPFVSLLKRLGQNQHPYYSRHCTPARSKSFYLTSNRITSFRTTVEILSKSLSYWVTRDSH